MLSTDRNFLLEQILSNISPILSVQGCITITQYFIEVVFRVGCLVMGCVFFADWFVLALYLRISWESGIFVVSFREGYEF